MPVFGVLARSAAIKAPAPRKKANGDCCIRRYRIGRSSGSLPRSACFNTSIGSGRLAGRTHLAWEVRGTLARAAFPAAIRSLTVRPRSFESSRTMLVTLACRAFASFKSFLSAACPSPHKMRHGVDAVKCRFPEGSLHRAFRNLTQRTQRKATESAEGLLEKNRNRRRKKKGRILCGSLC